MSLVEGEKFTQEISVHCTVVWTREAGKMGAHPAGQAAVLDGAGVPANSLGFVVSEHPLKGQGVIACHQLDAVPSSGPVLIRLDEVCFPIGAIAHRHTHCGPGIRYLVRGSLRVEAADHSQLMQAGDSWFEAAHSPVRAVATHTQGVSSFVRCMVLPVEWQGKSTFALIEARDGQLPRLQVTHRHIDHILQLDAG